MPKTPLEEALMDFVSTFDEVIFEDSCTDKMRGLAVEAYVHLRTVLATESIASLRAALEANPEAMSTMVDFDHAHRDRRCPSGDQCGGSWTGQKKSPKLPGPHDVSTGNIDAAADLEKKKAALRQAAVVVFEGFSIGLHGEGTASLTFNQDTLVWQICCTIPLNPPVIAGFTDRSHQWTWTLLPEFLEDRTKSHPALYAAGRERAANVLRTEAARKAATDNCPAKPPEPDNPTP